MVEQSEEIALTLFVESNDIQLFVKLSQFLVAPLKKTPNT